MVTESLRETFGFGNDNVIIRKFVDGIKGGKVLDTEGFDEKYIRAGHVVIRKDDEYKPLPVKDGAYEALPDGYEYVGFTVATVPTAEPFVSIVTIGEVNDSADALPYPLTTALKSAIKAAVPTIVFNHD